MRYRVAKHKRGFVCVIYDGPNRRRVGLKATDRFQATAEAGIPMSEIAAVLGHSDSRTTERVYAKLSPSYLQKAVRALG